MEDQHNSKENTIKAKQYAIKVHQYALMRDAQQQLKTHELDDITQQIKFQIVRELAQATLEASEVKQYKQMKDQYYQQGYLAAIFGLVSATLLPIPFKKLKQKSLLVKVPIYFGVFFISHKAFMFPIQYKSDEFNKGIINKYREQFLNTCYEL